MNKKKKTKNNFASVNDTLALVSGWKAHDSLKKNKTKKTILLTDLNNVAEVVLQVRIFLRSHLSVILTFAIVKYHSRQPSGKTFSFLKKKSNTIAE